MTQPKCGFNAVTLIWEEETMGFDQDNQIAIVGAEIRSKDCPDLTTFWRHLLDPNSQTNSRSARPSIIENTTLDQSFLSGKKCTEINHNSDSLLSSVWDDVIRQLTNQENDIVVLAAKSEENEIKLHLALLSTARCKGLKSYAIVNEWSSLTDKIQTKAHTIGSIEISPKNLTTQKKFNAILKKFPEPAGLMPHIPIGIFTQKDDRKRPVQELAQILKVALSLHQKIFLPTDIQTVDCRPETVDGFYFNKSAYPWFHGDPDNPRQAAIFLDEMQLILKEITDPAIDAKPILTSWPSELVLLSADSRDELLKIISRKILQIESRPAELMAMAAKSSQVKTAAHRLAIIVKDADDLKHKLVQAQQKLSDTNRTQIRSANGVFYSQSSHTDLGKTLLMFPGNGSQYTNMFFDLCLYFPIVRKFFDQLDQTFFMDDDDPPTSLLFPPRTKLNPKQQQSVKDYINNHEGGMQAGLIGSLSLYNFLREFQIPCDLMTGYSNGENAALLNSGTWHTHDDNEIFRVMRQLKLEMQYTNAPQHIPRGMGVAVSSVKRNVIDDLLKQHPHKLFIAMDNCQSQIVLFGKKEIMGDVVQILKDKGMICLPIPFDRSYHTELFKRKAGHIRQVFEQFDIIEPPIPLYSCVMLDYFPKDPSTIRDWISKQWHMRVRFRESIERLYDDGFRNFLEIGPGTLLTGFVKDTLKGKKDFVAISSNMERRSALEQVLYLFGQLWVRGFDVDVAKLYEAREHVSRLPSIPRTGTPPRGAVYRQESKAKAKILKQHFELMDEFLETQDRVFKRVVKLIQDQKKEGGRKTEDLAKTKNPKLKTVDDRLQTVDGMPFLGKILQRSETNIYAERMFTLDEDIFLKHHALGKTVSKDNPNLIPLPVIPFTMSMEILAEAACELDGQDRVVTCIKNIRGHRWLALDEGSLKLGIEAKRSGDDIAAKIFEINPKTHEKSLAFEAVVHLDKKENAEPQASRIQASAGKKPQLKFLEFYETCMFHGDSFRNVKEFLSFNEKSFAAELTVPPNNRLLKSVTHPAVKIPATLLDSSGQLAAFWLFEQGKRWFGLFPFYIETYYQYQAPASPATQLKCQAAIRYENEVTKTDFDITDGTGKLVAQIINQQSKFFDLGRDYTDMMYRLDTNAFLSKPELKNLKEIICRRISLTATLVQTGHKIWLRTMAHIYLNGTERKTWYKLAEKGPRRLEWLLGRIAAKDSVRKWASEKYQLGIWPADIEIVQNKFGKPFVVCQELAERGQIPEVSITHCGDCAIAAVCESAFTIGLDFESFEKRQVGDWLARAFTDEELALVPQRTPETLLALWSAKEAASKAAGTGLQGRWRQWKVQEISDDQRHVTVTFEGKMYPIQLYREGNEIIAICQLDVTNEANLSKQATA